jgi:hypothetical protein
MNVDLIAWAVFNMVVIAGVAWVAYGFGENAAARRYQYTVSMLRRELRRVSEHR